MVAVLHGRVQDHQVNIYLDRVLVVALVIRTGRRLPGFLRLGKPGRTIRKSKAALTWLKAGAVLAGCRDFDGSLISQVLSWNLSGSRERAPD